MANLRNYKLNFNFVFFWKKIGNIYFYVIYKSFEYCFLLLRNNVFKTSLYLVRKTLYYSRCEKLTSAGANPEILKRWGTQFSALFRQSLYHNKSTWYLTKSALLRFEKREHPPTEPSFWSAPDQIWVDKRANTVNQRNSTAMDLRVLYFYNSCALKFNTQKLK